MMCGLLVPTSGKALVLDMDLKVSSGKARQHLGYMAQKFSLYGNLTVEQNLRFFSGVTACADGRRTRKSPHERRLWPERTSPPTPPTNCRSALSSGWRWPAR
jgi:ABC-type multidrug transport system ATPase subunit